ncbi:MAG: hypothetical protein WAO11_12190, partial [Candidatus Acidiferrum sp.]
MEFEAQAITLDNSTGAEVHSQHYHRGLRLDRRIRVLVLALLLFCAGAHAQTEKSKTTSDTAAANSVYSKGMLALEQRDLAGARAAFEETVKLAPRSPE